MAASKVSLMVALVVALPGQGCVSQEKCGSWDCSHGRPLQAHHTTFLHQTRPLTVRAAAVKVPSRTRSHAVTISASSPVMIA